jgi:hypothetical protein
LEEILGLADEQTACREACESRNRAEIRGWAYDRTYRKRPAEERAWLGHDQIGLEILPAEGRRIEVGKHEIGIGGIGQRRCVARLVLPGLEVHGFGRADTEQDEQDLWVGDLLGQRRVEAAAALLDGGEIETK